VCRTVGIELNTYAGIKDKWIRGMTEVVAFRRNYFPVFSVLGNFGSINLFRGPMLRTRLAKCIALVSVRGRYGR
jgi:hypothetical protein